MGGRVGVFAVDTATGRRLAHRADERFILIAAYMSDPGGPPDDDCVRHEAGDVAIAKLVARALAG